MLDAFAADAAASPDDPTPRLVVADWLQDHGDSRAAEALRRLWSPSSPTWARDLGDRLLSGNLLPGDRFFLDPGSILSESTGRTPDPWQRDVLASAAERMLLLCTRQGGKSTVAGALAVQTAILEAPALILVLSPTERQSGELFRDKLMPVYQRLADKPRPVKQTELTLTLENGSRIVALPSNEAGIRGYSSVSLLIADEAARVPDDLYRAVRPMLAVGRGRLLALSTPFGKRGWFYEAWQSVEAWQRVRVTAEDCPRIPKEFLAEERRVLGERWYRQEYLTSFEDTIDAVFSNDDIMAAMDGQAQPLF